MVENKSSWIIGLGHYLPERRVTNEFFEGKKLKKIGYGGSVEKEVICSDAWIMQNMGIKERRYGGEHDTAHTMGAKALAMALEQAELLPSDLEGIITATVTSDKRFPSTACEIQNILGITKEDNSFFAYDIGAACAGYLHALTIADMHVRCGARAVGVVGVEKLSSINDLEDANSPLFGDGACAAVVVSGFCASSFITSEKKRAGGIIASHITSDSTADKHKAIYLDKEGKLRMPEGNKVLRFATRSMTAAVGKVKEKTGWTNDSIDLLIAHQANIRILEAVAKQTSLPMEKIYINIEKYGNMSSATCGVALSEAYREGRIKKGSKVILTSFGSGLLTSAIGLEYV